MQIFNKFPIFSIHYTSSIDQINIVQWEQSLSHGEDILASYASFPMVITA